MNVGKALYNILSSDADIVAICGTRVYPEIADQDAALPFIVYKVSDIQPSGTKSGSSSLDTARVDVYCVSEEYGEAMTISDEVRSALDRVGGTYTGVNIQSIDFDTADVEFDSDQRAYIAEATYNVRVMRVGQAPDINIQPLSILTVEEVDGDPSGLVNKLVVSNGALSIDGSTATITTGGAAGVSYHGRYDTEAETERSGATATLEVYYTARPDGDGFAESEVSDTGVTDTINRTLYYSTKYLADPDTAGDWTEYTTQPADNATFATAKAALLAGLNETDATAETRGTLPLSQKMVRTTGVAASDLLLDTYPGAAAAYSVRKLDKDYTGYCMKVRRASDDAEADIGFDSNGDLDTAAIAAHCTTSAGYVSVWYDQSGNSNNATQSTTSVQPQIYNGTSVNTENGKPGVQADDTPQRLDLTSNASVGSGFIVYRRTQSKTFAALLGLNYQNQIDSGASWGAAISAFDGTNQTSSATASDNSTQFLGSVHLGASSSVRINGSQDGTGTTGTLSVGSIFQRTNLAGNSSFVFVGRIQEIVLYATKQGASNITGIETEINTYFSIYT